MKKQLTLFFILLFCLTAVYGFQKWTIAHFQKQEENNILVQQVILKDKIGYSCFPPSGLGVKNIKTNEVTIYWDDDSGTVWEYIVQSSSDPYPTVSGTPSTTNEEEVTQDQKGNNLLPNTEYELYVRTYCDTGTKSVWEGPFGFKTLCTSFKLPFVEGFNSASPTLDCWTIVDGNQDATSPTGNNIWRNSGNFYSYEGDGAVNFTGDPNTNHDDWLISPAITLTGGVYEISWYYQTGDADNELEVLLSQNGTDISQFTKILSPERIYLSKGYLTYNKKAVYIKGGITGDIHIAWHMVASKYTEISLDMVSIREVDCVAPDEEQIVATDIKTDEATFEWIDNDNTQWEYHVRPIVGGIPPGSGTLISNKQITVTRTSGAGGPNLQPDTEYEFWIRSVCGLGKKSSWIGPFKFKTLCNVQTLPFWEDFNTESPTLGCWTIMDINGDAINPDGGNIWAVQNHFNIYEGDGQMYFYGDQNDASKRPHDDYLISPIFTLDAAKYYKLRYHYKTSTFYKNDFEVVLSNKGINPVDFTKELLTKKGDSDGTWREEKIIIGGVGGDVNIAWHVNTDNTNTRLYVDNVFLEELTCPEPWNLGSKNEKENSIVLFWTDDIGSDWEYIVQKPGGGAPLQTIAGTATKSKEITVTADKNGNTLEQNTEYELYVRTKCADGSLGVWSELYKFRTACKVYGTPFWESFNLDSESANCWTIVDGNDDSVLAKTNVWDMSSTRYEGTHSMHFYGDQIDPSKRPHDDWLISPRIRLESGKMYRLKYHYRTNFVTSNYDDHEFEVLLSNSGISINKFMTTIIPKKQYDPTTEWIEEHAFISGVSGDVNIAWHITSETSHTYLYVDNVFLEEVKGCSEPLPITMGVEDIEKDKVTIFWDDDFGATVWEYYIQESGRGIPKGNGIAVTNKKSVVSFDNAGDTLKPNTDYEFYVRTDCGNGEYSIWSGPYLFTTTCGVYTTPFWEGFNTNSKSYKCWTIDDSKMFFEFNSENFRTRSDVLSYYEILLGSSPVFEGDGNEVLGNPLEFLILGSKQKESRLTSPSIQLNGGTYVLKYHYYALSKIVGLPVETLVEMVISGKDSLGKPFEQKIIAEKPYQTTAWQEEIQFISGISGEVNIEWRVRSSDTIFGLYVFGIDNVFVKEVKTCPEPYYVTVTSQTSTTIDIEWEQYDNATEWEVVIVDYGESETVIPIQTITVTGTPQAKIAGLSEGKAYTIYVRAKCKEWNSYSAWTPITGVTKVGASNICDGAIVIPVNNSLECIESIDVTLFGATASPSLTPACAPKLKNDIWFEFIAKSKLHLFILEGLEEGVFLEGAIYDTACNSINATPLECFQIPQNESSVYFNSNKKLLKNLNPGQRYYIRLGTSEDTSEDKWSQIVLTLCLTASPYLEVTESGTQYTTEELVKEVLVNSNCNLVSNVHYQNGDGSPTAQWINILGYFNRGESDFPFEEGVVLSTAPVKYVPGPYGGEIGFNLNSWTGDKYINDVINDAGGMLVDDKRVAQLKFDFIPVTDSIRFEYLLASNSYTSSCYACQNAALFAALLIDSTTGEGQNLAKVPGTSLPISLNTIWDSQKIFNTSCNVNPEFFWNSYDFKGNANPLDAPFNFVGSTIAMSSEKVPVVPGRKYHIKMAVVDFCDIPEHVSAVFFNANSFDLGNLDLGSDLLVATNNALCQSDSVVIRSGVVASDELYMEIEWYKNGVLMPGANNLDLEVDEAGEYAIKVKFPELKCEFSDSIVVEIYPSISEVVHQPEMIKVCQYSLQETIVDLTIVENIMFEAVDRNMYTTSYHLTAEEATATENVIANAERYSLGKESEAQTVYIRVENTGTGCYEVFDLPIQPQKGEIPKKPENVAVCSEYVFPDVNSDQYYYAEPGGQGEEYRTGDILAEPGEHTIYLLQVYTEEGCYEETAYQVNITAPVVADVFEDKILSCEYYQLNPLSEYNQYFKEPEGKGEKLYPGMQILQGQTIYLYASSEDGLCTDESSFTIAYEDCPIPRGISPNKDGLNDVFDLTPHGVESIKIYNRWGTEVYSYGAGYTTQWHGQNKSGKQLPDGTYYYVIRAHGKIRTGWVQINK